MKSSQRKGLFFILIAAALLGNAFNVFQITSSVFKLVLSAMLLSYSLSSLFRRRFTEGFLSGSLVYLMNESLINEALGLRNVNGWMLFWGVLFLGIGLDSLFKKRSRYFSNNSFEFNKHTKSKDNDDIIIDIDGVQSGEFSKESYKESINEDSIRIESNFTERTRYINVDNLTHGHIETNFGALRVYFDQSTFNANGSKLHVDCNFGKITLFIPRDLNIINNVTSTFGANMGQEGFTSGNGPTVVIDGDVSFGGFKIIRI